MVKRGKFQVDPFGVTVHIHLMGDTNECLMRAKQVHEQHSEEYPFGGNPLSGYTYQLADRPKEFHVLLSATDLTVNTITHESDHLRDFILEEMDVHDSETSAELAGLLNEQIFQFLQRNKFQIHY